MGGSAEAVQTADSDMGLIVKRWSEKPMINALDDASFHDSPLRAWCSAPASLGIG